MHAVMIIEASSMIFTTGQKITLRSRFLTADNTNVMTLIRSLFLRQVLPRHVTVFESNDTHSVTVSQ